MNTPTSGSETPAPTGDDDDDNSVNAIQKLTGKLTQKMRAAAQEMQPTDYKSVINSILSAVDMKQLSDQDKKDIMKKLKGGQEQEVSEENYADYENNLEEYGEQFGYDDDESYVDNEPSRFRASGGQTIGEDALNERLDIIINNAKKNVLNKIKK